MGNPQGYEELLSCTYVWIYGTVLYCRQPFIFIVDTAYVEKHNRIIGRLKSKIWVHVHKFGVNIPNSVQEANAFYEENRNTLWWDAICKEINNIRPDFEFWEKDIS